MAMVLPLPEKTTADVPGSELEGALNALKENFAGTVHAPEFVVLSTVSARFVNGCEGMMRCVPFSSEKPYVPPPKNSKREGVNGNSRDKTQRAGSLKVM